MKDSPMPTARFSILAVLFALAIQGPAFAADPLMCLPGKVIFEDSFSTPSLDSRWTIPKGDWTVSEQALRGSELAADKHSAVIRTDVEFPKNFIIRFKFRFNGGKAIHCSFNGKGHICRATLTPDGYTLKGEKVKSDSTDRSVTVGQVQQKFTPGKWHTMQIEVAGNEFAAQVDDGPIAFGTDKKIGRAKTNFGFPMLGTYSEIDDIEIWNADLNPNWAARKKTLPPNKIIPPKPPTAEKRFKNLDKNDDGSISLKEFTNPRTPDKRAAAEEQFKRRDKNQDGKMSLREYSPAKK
ncbi:hypothetical protein N9X53_04935 [Mariniblastus sp.]|nr:hypothetical protein [Mariniblastus sp.]